MDSSTPLVSQRKFAKPLPQNRVKTVKKNELSKSTFPTVSEDEKSGRKSPGIVISSTLKHSKSREDLFAQPQIISEKDELKHKIDEENEITQSPLKDNIYEDTKKSDWKPPRYAFRNNRNVEPFSEDTAQPLNGSPQIPSGIILSVKHTHHLNSNTEVLGFIKHVRVKVDEQWSVKGIINLTSLNGFIYFDFIPLKTVPTLDILLRRWQNPVNDINDYKVAFCFRDCIGVRYKQAKKNSLPMSPFIYEVSFDFNTLLPFVIPVYQFKFVEDVEYMLKSIVKKGIKLIPEKGDEREGYYKIETKLCNNEMFRRSMSTVGSYTKKVNSDPIRNTSRKQWMNSHSLDVSLCDLKYIETHNQVNEVQNAVKYVGCDDNSRCISWMICGGEMKDFKRKNEIIEGWRKKYDLLKTQWKSFLPEQKKRWKDIESIEIQVEKDLNRTMLDAVQWSSKPVDELKNILLCYGIYDMETMYMQGMNEICAVCMESCNSELDSFIMFNLVMTMMRPFYLIQTNTTSNLNKIKVIIRVIDKEIAELFEKAQVDYMFCWRSVALLFKREMNKIDIKRLWDFIVAKPEDKMYLFVMVAIISMHREFILSQELDFDLMMQFMLTLSNVFDKQLIWDADMVCNEFKTKASKEEIDEVFGI